MSVKRNKISLYVRQVPHSSILEVSPISKFNPYKRIIQVTEEEYKDFCEWLDNGTDDILFALPFLNEPERELIKDCVKIRYTNNDEEDFDDEIEMEHTLA